MNKVIIFTDSTADLTYELYKDRNIHVVPLIVTSNGIVYKDDGSYSLEKLFEDVSKNGILPTTAAVSPNAYIDAFTPFIQQGYDIVYIGIGKDLSSNYQSVTIALNEFPKERIHLVDSKNLSSATGLLVLKACDLRDKGKSASDIAKQISIYAERMSAQFIVATMDYLYKGGRCSGAKFLIGRLLHVHPMLKVVDGILGVYKTPKGKIVKAYDELLKEFVNDYPNIDKDYVMVTHALSNEGVPYITNELKKYVDKESIIVTRTGLVIASHCGKETIGILYLKSK